MVGSCGIRRVAAKPWKTRSKLRLRSPTELSESGERALPPDWLLSRRTGGVSTLVFGVDRPLGIPQYLFVNVRYYTLRG